MLAAEILNPPIQYSLIWLIIGLLLLVTIAVWYGLVFWLTRNRPPKTLNNLTQLQVGTELEQLKAKYLKLVEEYYQRYQRKEIDARELHHGLSILARYFVFEVKHFPAPTLTLADLKRGPYPNLAQVIADYYPEEFAAISRGEVIRSVELARQFIQQWV